MPRPVYCFRNFIGHRKVVELLLRQMRGAIARGEPFPTACFAGPSGVGKTLLAKTLAAEYGTSLIEANGFESIAEISSKFIGASACDFVFLDEAHRLASKSQELLYHVIDDLRVPLWDTELAKPANDEDAKYRPINPCSVILATDQPGRLLNALHKRIEMPVNIDYYPFREMKEIVDRLATDLNLLITPQASNRLAEVSRGLPRKAKQLLQNLRRHFPGCESHQIELPHVRQFLQMFEIDDVGLNGSERRYLRYLLDADRASLESLAISLGLDAEFVRRQIEPQLLRKQFIVIRPGGRELTASGREWITRCD